jgi:ferredoxin--NADP+ reductase
MSRPGTEENPLRVAIVGSGPSGFYATEALIKSGITTRVDMYERLPVPYGLVRSGVAPDHPKLKQAMQVYAKIAESPEFRFFGNVTIGKDIQISDLQSLYHAIILTCGAESDRRLGIPGEDLKGSYTATEFVGWYNGHPDYRDREFDLSHDTAIIFGQGNVAADVSRILAKTRDELKHTDIAEHALDALDKSNIKHIYVIGRRGPAQAKFTSKELKEFGELVDCDPVLVANELDLNPQSESELEDKSNAGNRKVFELFQGFSQQSPADGKNKRVYFTFLKSPVEILGSDRVEGVKLEENALSGDPFNQSARGTGNFSEIKAGIVFRSIGYKGVALPSVPFDEKRGIIPNDDGRVTDNNGAVVQGLYTAGWIKRGPSGIIGTNRADSVATVKALTDDLENGIVSGDKPGDDAALQLLNDQNVNFVSFTDWQKIDASEIARGEPKGKPREKYTYIQEMLDLISQD